MNKYYNYDNPSQINEFTSMLMPNETILWHGIPKKSAYIINASVKMLPIAIIWLLFDGFFIFNMISGSMMMGGMNFIMIPFFLIHLFPVWIWLGSTLTASRRWKNTQYAVTDKRILIRNGLIGYDYKSIYYTEINNVNLRVGMIDKMLGVGDIYLSLEGFTSKGHPIMSSIVDIEEPQKAFKIIQQAVLDIQTDIHYPNALRPETNPGYKTEYRPED